MTRDQRAAGQSHQTSRQGQRPRIVRSATEARQGEIILGRRGIWIWLASFAVIAVLALILAV